MANSQGLVQLPPLIREEKEALLRAWRAEVRLLPIAGELDVPTLNDHIPDLLMELAEELELCTDESMVAELRHSPIIHGLDRLERGFDVEEVVAEYNALRGVVLDMIESHGLRVGGRVSHTINRVIDRSIGLAVKTYAAQRALEVQQKRHEHLAFVAHDLRTPLSAVSMSAKLLELTLPAEVRNSEETVVLLDTIERNVSRLSGLIRDVVQGEANLAALLSGHMELQEVNLRKLVDQLVHDLRSLAVAARTKVNVEIPVSLTLQADPALMLGVFQNLLSNALEYTKNGTVTVGAGQSEGVYECWVSDTGEGISLERLPLVFDKLHTDPKRHGMGLGLAIVKQSVEAHGGRVTAESQLGVGTTFRFWLPVNAPAPSPGVATA